jgi:hypothetical protein
MVVSLQCLSAVYCACDHCTSDMVLASLVSNAEAAAGFCYPCDWMGLHNTCAWRFISHAFDMTWVNDSDVTKAPCALTFTIDSVTEAVD